jgi:hypothetical protein
MFIDMAFGSPIYERLRALGFNNAFETNFGLPVLQNAYVLAASGNGSIPHFVISKRLTTALPSRRWAREAFGTLPGSPTDNRGNRS